MVAPAQTARICSTTSGNSPPENGKLVVLETKKIQVKQKLNKLWKSNLNLQGVELSLMFVEALQFDHKSTVSSVTIVYRYYLRK
jgi:hypothetical protein